MQSGSNECKWVVERTGKTGWKGRKVYVTNSWEIATEIAKGKNREEQTIKIVNGREKSVDAYPEWLCRKIAKGLNGK